MGGSPDQQPASNQNRSCRRLSGPSHAVASQKCDQRPAEVFGRIESAIPGPTAQRGACAGEQDGSSLSRNNAWEGPPSDKKSAIADDPPAFLEIVRFHFENTTGRIVACIIDRKIYIGTGMFEDRGHVRLGRPLYLEPRSLSNVGRFQFHARSPRVHLS